MKDLLVRAQPMIDQGVPRDLAVQVAAQINLLSGLDIVRLAAARKLDVVEVSRLYFSVGGWFRLGKLRAAAEGLESETHWQKLAVAALIEEVYSHQAALTAQVLDFAPKVKDPDKAIDKWVEANRGNRGPRQADAERTVDRRGRRSFHDRRRQPSVAVPGCAGIVGLAADPKTEGRGVTPRALFAWCSYDWANSAFPTVITTFVFGAYFTKAVAADEVTGTAQWSYAMSLSALAIAVAGPVLGAVADHGGRRKPWIALFTALCVLLTAALWYARPEVSHVLVALVLAASANFAFEMGGVFYNAMMADLVPAPRLGRLSGWAWGLGYAGGLSCLVVGLVLFVQPDPPRFGLDKQAAEHVRATALLVAAWFAVFSLPLFLWTPDTPATGLGLAAAARRGLGTLVATLRRIGSYRQIVRFLLARMIYIDGLNTLFTFGGIYAAGTFGLGFTEIMIFGIGLNVAAGLGAAAFAWIDDAIGSKRTILIAVAGLAGFGTVLVVIEDLTLFWIFGLGLGIFVGPAQAASRSMMARMAPEHLRAEMFGLFAFSGKATAFLGPALLGAVTAATGSQRAGMATILVFFAVGGLLLLSVREPARGSA